MTTTGARFRQRELPGGDAAEFVKAGLSAVPQRHHVSVRVHTPAEVVRRAVGHWGLVEELAGDACRLTMEVDDLAWPLFVLAGVEAEFEIEGPEELLEAYGGGQQSGSRGQPAAEVRLRPRRSRRRPRWP